MSFQIYKPNSKNQGSALNINISLQKGKEPLLFINLIRQFSWNADTKKGSFAGNKDQPEHTVNMKIGASECGEIISAISNRYNYSAFHTFNNNSTTLTLSPWDQPSRLQKYNPSTKTQEPTGDILPSFGLSLKKGSFNPIKIPLGPGECELILHYFKRFLSSYFDYLDSPEHSNSFREISKQDISNKKNDDLFIDSKPALPNDSSKPIKTSQPNENILDGDPLGVEDPSDVDDESEYY